MNYELNLLSKLVSFDTNSETRKDYLKCAEFIALEAKKLGLKAKIVNAKDSLDPRPSVIIKYDIGAEKTVLLAAHFDVVAPGDGWKTNPFKLIVKKGKAYGRGANDDKAAIASAFGALKELKQEKSAKRNVILLCSCDEEVGGELGVGFVCRKHKKDVMADSSFILDSSLEHINIGCSGRIEGTITLKGKQGHAGYPYRGPNIIHDAIPFLNELLEFKKIREKKRSFIGASKASPFRKVYGRFSITILNAGVKHNVIPGELKTGFDLRLIPEEKLSKAKKEFLLFYRKLVKKYKLKAKLSLKGKEGYFIEKNHPEVLRLKKITRKVFGRPLSLIGALGGNDGPKIQKAGIPVVCFTPGRDKNNVHGLNEFTPVKDLQLCKQIIKEMCK